MIRECWDTVLCYWELGVYRDHKHTHIQPYTLREREGERERVSESVCVGVTDSQ